MFSLAVSSGLSLLLYWYPAVVPCRRAQCHRDDDDPKPPDIFDWRRIEALLLLLLDMADPPSDSRPPLVTRIGPFWRGRLVLLASATIRSGREIPSALLEPPLPAAVVIMLVTELSLLALVRDEEAAMGPRPRENL
jgi:hypothetical protein